MSLYRFLETHVRPVWMSGAWSDMCRAARRTPGWNEASKLLMKELDLMTDEMRDDWAPIATAMTAALASPAVEYMVANELLEAMSTFRLPEGTVGENIQLPHLIMAVRIADAPKTGYVITIKDDTGFAVVTGTSVWAARNEDNLKDSILTGDEATDVWIRRLLGTLAYLVHGQDTRLEPQEKRGSGKKFRNKEFIPVIRGTVGGKFTTAFRRWAKATGGDGTHASPRPHLRAGHWHAYWTGKGRTERVLRFLHPCLVNADEVGDVTIERKVGY